MKNPNGSDVPGARRILIEVLASPNLTSLDRYDIERALDKMTRQKAVRRARTQQTMPITSDMKRRIYDLSGDPSLSNADIAKAVGLPPCASGRISEVLQGLR